VAAEEPRSHPLGFLSMGSPEGVGVRRENFRVLRICGSASSMRETPYVLILFAV
jgi:hypothetical protein